MLYYAIAIMIYQAFNISFLEHQFQYKGQIVGVTVILSAFIVNYSTYLVLRAMENVLQVLASIYTEN